MSEAYKNYPLIKDQARHHRTIRRALEGDTPDFYAGLVSYMRDGRNVSLALSIEGVGTKILVAQLARDFSTIGQDLVAMNVNDVICLGATPIAFADYIALGGTFPDKLLRQLMEGINRATKEAGIQTVAGETAEVPEMVAGVERDLAIDLSGSCVGDFTKDPVYGKQITDRDVIVGLSSSGLHSNGFTLARKALLRFFRENDKPCADYDVDDVFQPTGQKITKELLTPTSIYCREINEAMDETSPHGLAHITGAGFRKLLRLCSFSGKGLEITDPPEPPAIMKEIQRIRNIESEEMYGTFNMGIGFCVVLPKENADHLISICRRHGTEAKIIGRATSEYRDVVKIELKERTIAYANTA